MLAGRCGRGRRAAHSRSPSVRMNAFVIHFFKKFQPDSGALELKNCDHLVEGERSAAGLHCMFGRAAASFLTT